jgi:hypothetical protein
MSRTCLMERVRAWSMVLALLIGPWSSGLMRSQWTVPGPLQLDGVTDAERQVIISGDAVSGSDALNLSGVRRQLGNTGVVSSTGASWVVTVGNEGTTLSEGAVIQFLAPSTTPAGLMLDVNGMGPLPVLGWEGMPLDSGTWVAGSAIRVVRATDHYMVLDKVRASCPPGFITYGAGACIAASWRGPATFFAAADSCLASGTRLCTFAEWTAACTLVPNFMDQVSQPEWIDHAANSTNYAKVIGVGENGYSGAGTGCDYGGIRLPTNNARFRCCTER